MKKNCDGRRNGTVPTEKWHGHIERKADGDWVKSSSKLVAKTAAPKTWQNTVSSSGPLGHSESSEMKGHRTNGTRLTLQ